MARFALWALVIFLATVGGGFLLSVLTAQPHKGFDFSIALFFLLTAGALFHDFLRDR